MRSQKAWKFKTKKNVIVNSYKNNKFQILNDEYEKYGQGKYLERTVSFQRTSVNVPVFQSEIEND